MHLLLVFFQFLKKQYCFYFIRQHQVKPLSFTPNVKMMSFFKPTDLCDRLIEQNIWDKILKNGPSKVCGRQPLKNLKRYYCLSTPYPFKFFKGFLPQILLGPLLNTCPIWCLLDVMFIVKYVEKNYLFLIYKMLAVH